MDASGVAFSRSRSAPARLLPRTRAADPRPLQLDQDLGSLLGLIEMSVAPGGTKKTPPRDSRGEGSTVSTTA